MDEVALNIIVFIDFAICVLFARLYYKTESGAIANFYLIVSIITGVVGFILLLKQLSPYLAIDQSWRNQT